MGENRDESQTDNTGIRSDRDGIEADRNGTPDDRSGVNVDSQRIFRRQFPDIWQTAPNNVAVPRF